MTVKYLIAGLAGFAVGSLVLATAVLVATGDPGGWEVWRVAVTASWAPLAGAMLGAGMAATP